MYGIRPQSSTFFETHLLPAAVSALNCFFSRMLKIQPFSENSFGLLKELSPKRFTTMKKCFSATTHQLFPTTSLLHQTLTSAGFSLGSEVVLINN
jgi:hypothetical protein